MLRIWVPIRVVMLLAVCIPPGVASETPASLPTQVDHGDADFRLGLNAAQTTPGAIGRLAGASRQAAGKGT